MKHWIQTYTGKAFDLLNPTPEMVEVTDIAHHLALINRFTGATAVPYSVAQHSVLVSQVVPPGMSQRCSSIRELPSVFGFTRSRSRNSATPSSYERRSSS